MKTPLAFDSVLAREGVGDLCVDVLEGEDQDDLAEAAKKIRAARSGGEGRSASEGESESQSKKLKKMAEKDLMVLDLSKKYLPIHPECTLVGESHWHLRFKVTYPTKFPPHSYSQCYEEHDRASALEAIRGCLLWAWTVHFEATKEVCPWNLAD